LSRVVVTRTDAGKDRFNYSGILGMSAGIALSNAYYPDSSVSAGEVGYRFGTSAGGFRAEQSFAGILARYSREVFPSQASALRVPARSD
jgi:hypothetical protein